MKEENNDIQPLLTEFEVPTPEEWRKAAEELLKGAPFEKVMRTRTVEGLTVEPIYRRQDTEGLASGAPWPGEPGSVRGTRAAGYLENSWEIAQEIPYGDPARFNEALLADLGRGQDAVVLTVDHPTALGLNPGEARVGDVASCGLSLARVEDFEAALRGVLPDAVRFHLRPGSSGLALGALFLAWARKTGVDPATLRGAFHADPCGFLAAEGRIPGGIGQAFDELAAWFRLGADSLPGFALLGVGGIPVHEAGGSAVDELASVLSSAVATIRALADRGIPPAESAPRIAFTFALGRNFFMELAKLRAFRLLWSRVTGAYGLDPAASRPLVYGRTGHFNKTRTDPYVNMLRTTTEALCGVLGGVDGLTVGAFDEVIREPDTFSRRIARNTQVILAEECSLRRVVDPAGGSWYLEKLTDDLARSAWAAFQELEGEGGFLAALGSGSLARRCEASREAAEKLLNQRRLSLVGTNVYANGGEAPLDARAPDYEALHRARGLAVGEGGHACQGSLAAPESLVGDALGGATLACLTAALGRNGGASAVEPLRYRRLSRGYEELREAARRYEAEKGHRPRLHLFNLGALKQHKVRADFTRGFFEAGGFEVVYPAGASTPEEGLGALRESGARVAVVCGTDDLYGERFEDTARAIKAALPGVLVVLAGAPGDREAAFREAGMDAFIFAKSPHYDTNLAFLRHAGVSV